ATSESPPGSATITSPTATPARSAALPGSTSLTTREAPSSFSSMPRSRVQSCAPTTMSATRAATRTSTVKSVRGKIRAIIEEPSLPFYRTLPHMVMWLPDRRVFLEDEAMGRLTPTASILATLCTSFFGLAAACSDDGASAPGAPGGNDASAQGDSGGPG